MEDFEEVEGYFVLKEIVQRYFRKPLKEHIEGVKTMDLREDDVFLCSFPKSGMCTVVCFICQLKSVITRLF